MKYPETFQLLSRRAHCSEPMHALQGLECQHGPEECRLNRIFACAIDLSKTPKDYWPFVECVESNYGAKIEDSLDGCAKDNGFKLKDLEACASGDASFCWALDPLWRAKSCQMPLTCTPESGGPAAQSSVVLATLEMAGLACRQQGGCTGTGSGRADQLSSACPSICPMGSSQW